MKTVKNKDLLVGADFAGFPLKEAVVPRPKSKDWEITDVGVRLPENTDLMFHRIGLGVGSLIVEAFDYDEYKANGFKVKHLGDYLLTLETKKAD